MTVMLLGYGPTWLARTLDDLVIPDGWRITRIWPWWCEAGESGIDYQPAGRRATVKGTGC